MSDETIPGTKRCSKCREHKPATREFFPANRGRKDGWGTWCKVCFNTMAAPKRPPPKPKLTTEERFWKKTDKNGPTMPHMTTQCWTTACAKDDDGYGRFFLPAVRNNVPAHGYSWMLHNGQIPNGMQVNHHCDNRPCVRPDHLFLGTQQDNMRDKVQKLRHARGESQGNAKLTNDEVLDIRRLHADGVTRAELQDRFNVSKTVIARIVTGNTWTHLLNNN